MKDDTRSNNNFVEAKAYVHQNARQQNPGQQYNKEQYNQFL